MSVYKAYFILSRLHISLFTRSALAKAGPVEVTQICKIQTTVLMRHSSLCMPARNKCNQGQKSEKGHEKYTTGMEYNCSTQCSCNLQENINK